MPLMVDAPLARLEALERRDAEREAQVWALERHDAERDEQVQALQRSVAALELRNARLEATVRACSMRAILRICGFLSAKELGRLACASRSFREQIEWPSSALGMEASCMERRVRSWRRRRGCGWRSAASRSVDGCLGVILRSGWG